MNRRKMLALLLSALMVLSAAVLSACQPTKAPDKTEADVTVSAPSEKPTEPQPETTEPEKTEPEETEPVGVSVTDMTGRQVALDQKAEKVVVLDAADCEILYALGAGDTVIGRGEYCDYPAEVFDVPSVESGGNTNIEQIVALEPDVVIMTKMAQTVEHVQQIEKAGVPVFVSDAQNIQGVYEAISLIGALVGRESEAETLVSSMKEAFDDLSAQAGDGTKTVYFEVSPLEYGLWTAGKGTFMDEVAGLLGLRNCFDDVEGWGEISEEQVLERNPDYIVTTAMYFGDGPTPVEEIAVRAGWENVPAVRDNAILNLPNNELTRPGPRLVDGARMLFELVYGAAGEAELDDAA